MTTELVVCTCHMIGYAFEDSVPNTASSGSTIENRRVALQSDIDSITRKIETCERNIEQNVQALIPIFGKNYLLRYNHSFIRVLSLWSLQLYDSIDQD